MNNSRTTKLATFLALVAASPACDAFAFTPSPVQQRQQVQLSAMKNDDANGVADGWRKMSGGAAAFVTGLGIMAQVAFADPSAIAPTDECKFYRTQTHGILRPSSQ